MTAPAAVMRTIEGSYGSLSEPSYSFVEEKIAARPYAELIDELSRFVRVEETTDANDDVSFRYLLTQGQDKWALNLSMVGPYGLLMRLSGGGPPEVITELSPADASREADLLALIERTGVQLLSRETLEKTIPLRRPGEEAEVTNLYQALISDEPLLPWQSPD
jgi:hypothetical protein